MKEVKFRIIELPTHQVLLTKDFDNDNDDDDASLLLMITVFFEDAKVDLKMHCRDEKVRDKLFSEMTEEKAQGFLDKCESQFEQTTKTMYKITQQIEWTNKGRCLVKRHYKKVSIFGIKFWSIFHVKRDFEKRDITCC
jgi:hypothetical protein